jgi:hypothetical protein
MPARMCLLQAKFWVLLGRRREHDDASMLSISLTATGDRGAWLDGPHG